MGAKPVFEACVKNGSYKKNGEDKVKWLKIGTVFETDKGYSMLLECMPIGAQAPVWASLFPVKEKDGVAVPNQTADSDAVPF